VSYGKVHDVFWEGDKVVPLSDRAALLGLFLITGPHRNAIGCFKLGIGALTDNERFQKWGIEGVLDALSEMVKTGFILRDPKTGWTLIDKALELDPIKGEKQAIHAAKLALSVPIGSPIYSALYQRLNPQLEAQSKALKAAPGWPMRTPVDAPSDTHANGYGIVKPSPSPSPLPLPEPEPDSLTVAPDGASVSEGDSDELDLPAFLDRSPEGEALRSWNAMAERAGLATARSLNDTRRKKLRARLSECGGIAGWNAALAKIPGNSFLCGGGPSGWRADFDFVIQQKSFTKLVEGGFDPAPTTGKTTHDAYRGVEI